MLAMQDTYFNEKRAALGWILIDDTLHCTDCDALQAWHRAKVGVENALISVLCSDWGTTILTYSTFHCINCGWNASV